MFMLGNLQIRMLKMLAKEQLSIIRLYEVLMKEGVAKLSFENAMKSLEKKKLIHVESLSLRLTENGRKMFEILEALAPLSVTLEQRKREDLVKLFEPKVKKPVIKRQKLGTSPTIKRRSVGTYISRRGKVIRSTRKINTLGLERLRL